jgi:serine/threonine-protein kinase RsbW
VSANVVTLVMPAKSEYLILARLALAGIARERPIEESVLADLKLAVTEACGNAVRHAYQAGEGSVDLAFVLADDRLEMIVEDEGAGIGLPVEDLIAETPEAALSGDAANGGMGLAIIRAIVDELDVHGGPSGRGTVVHMTKYLDPAAQSA